MDRNLLIYRQEQALLSKLICHSDNLLRSIFRRLSVWVSFCLESELCLHGIFYSVQLKVPHNDSNYVEITIYSTKQTFAVKADMCDPDVVQIQAWVLSAHSTEAVCVVNLIEVWVLINAQLVKSLLFTWNISLIRILASNNFPDKLTF